VGVAAAARLLYHEKYVGCPMRSHVEHNSANGDASGVLSFAWRSPKGWLSIGSRYRGSSCLLQPGTEAHFVAQHYWGYGKRNDGRTLEYHVSHPTWSTWEAEDVFAKGPFAGFYGPEFGKVLSSEPSSAFVADGSDVEIDPPTLIS
jgi:hypothetical protein